MGETNDQPRRLNGTRRSVRSHVVLRRTIQPQEMLGLACGFALFAFLIATLLFPIVHPIFPLVGLVFFLYPLRKVIVPRRTMQLGIGAFMLWLFLNLSGALFPFIMAFIIAYIFSPLVNYFQRRGVRRWISALGVTLGMLGIYALVGVFIVPGLIEQFQQLLNSAQGLLKNSDVFDHKHLVSELQRLGLSPTQANDLVTNEIEPQLKQIVGWLIKSAGSFVKGASSILEGVVNLLLIPLLTLYLLIDFSRFRNFLRITVLRENARYVYYFRQVDGILSSYLRGIMITSSLVGSVATAILSAFGVPYAVLIGILTGVFNLIPSVGIFLNLGVAAVIFLFSPASFGTNMLITTTMVFGLHALNAYIVEPRVIGDRVGLPPVLLIGSLFVFAHFLGFIGLLVAVPTSAVIAMFLREWYRQSVMDGGRPWDDEANAAIAAAAAQEAPATVPGPAH